MIENAFVAVLVAALLTLTAEGLRRRSGLVRRLYIPASIIAGGLAVLLGPEALGAVAGAAGVDALDGGIFPAAVVEAWGELPTWLISVVFAGLFLGKTIPSPREIWHLAGPQVALGQTIAWGQYAVGLTLALLVLGPAFGLDPMAGALIEIGFEGGHGTAGGLGETFEELGFEEGLDLALGLATVGLVMGVLIGTAIINWAARSGRLPHLDAEPGTTDDASELDADPAKASSEGAAADVLSLHLGLLAVAIGLGYAILEALQALERLTWGAEGVRVLEQVPLFPLAMIGGVVVQVAIDRWRPGAVDAGLTSRITGAALDLTIVSALGAMSLEVIGDNLEPFLLLAAAGIVWNVAALLLLAPRIIPRDVYERAIGDFGQSMGTTVSGLLLMRTADPQNRSNALESFGSKQLLFEPVVGGGIFTGASLPLIAEFGAVPVLILTALVCAGWIAVGVLVFGRRA